MSTLVIANRSEEIHFFQRMISSEVAYRIYLIQGDSGKGKSTLLHAFSHVCHTRHISQVAIDLKNYKSLGEVFDAICDELDWKHFPTYISRKEFHAKFRPARAIVEVAENEIGNNNVLNINPTIQFDAVKEQEQRNQDLTQAIFKDLQIRDVPTIFVLDSYDSAIPEIQQWLQTRFLSEVRRSKCIKTVLAGITVPAFDISWENSTQRAILNEIGDIDAWHQFAQYYHKEFPRGKIETLCEGTHDPNILSMLIRNICNKAQGL